MVEALEASSLYVRNSGRIYYDPEKDTSVMLQIEPDLFPKYPRFSRQVNKVIVIQRKLFLFTKTGFVMEIIKIRDVINSTYHRIITNK